MERWLLTSLTCLIMAGCNSTASTPPCNPGDYCPEQETAELTLFNYETADRCDEMVNPQSKADCKAKVDAINEAIKQRRNKQ
ncbi:hypothetical protein L9G15_18185 [Shewanella sp. A3A]|uniref:Lipoprotein n=1 Tax=Shewanella electrica TaxID=515560 RepID=A0ABT2FQN8_9GAMM|nr:hypothetical protein [Shewanella electrica]MCH1921355.1 hypothetical protein [Shewanella ferrihydritica]MCH1926125.1 hypothetical protein [Shewanella electrica]MCS4557506.1 hypothetical protein [Shewanella electrica]